MMIPGRGAFAVGAVLALALAGPAQACSLDNTPSISANGRLARLNTSRPSYGNLAHWAVFTFPSAFRAGQAIRLGENTVDLHRSLPVDAFGAPWRWHFGDGSSGSGFTATHRYARAGTYKITLYAYYRSNHAWYQFDDVLVQVR